jgi:hypothetical protein
MERNIKRRYGWNATDMRNVVIAYLKTVDLPYPKDLSATKWSMTDQGAMLEWTEDDEMTTRQP